MTLQDKLNAMKTTKTGLFFHSSSYSSKYTVQLEFSGENRRGFTLNSAEHLTLEEAVDEIYGEFCKLTQHSFKEAIPAQLTYEKNEGNVVEFPETPPNSMRDTDDKVPF